MEVTAKGLRTRVREVLDCVDRGEAVVVTYRGKPRARLAKVESAPAATATSGIAGFGMEGPGRPSRRGGLRSGPAPTMR